jgi:hypothetical protein
MAQNDWKSRIEAVFFKKICDGQLKRKEYLLLKKYYQKEPVLLRVDKILSEVTHMTQIIVIKALKADILKQSATAVLCRGRSHCYKKVTFSIIDDIREIEGTTKYRIF